MSEKQFKLSSETVLQYQIMDNDTDLNENEVCDLLNEQQATINELKERNLYNFAKKMQLQKEIKELKEEEKLYAKEIMRLNKNIEELNKTIEEALKFKSLGGDY